MWAMMEKLRIWFKATKKVLFQHLGGIANGRILAETSRVFTHFRLIKKMAAKPFAFRCQNRHRFIVPTKTSGSASTSSTATAKRTDRAASQARRVILAKVAVSTAKQQPRATSLLVTNSLDGNKGLRIVPAHQQNDRGTLIELGQQTVELFDGLDFGLRTTADYGKNHVTSA